MLRRVVWNGALAVAALMYFLSSRDIAEVRELAARGRQTKAHVTLKYVRSGKSTSYHVRYRFTAEGQRFADRFKVNAKRYKAIQPGDALTVTYLPQTPEVHQPGIVDASRIANSVQAWTLGWFLTGLVTAAALGGFEWYLAEQKRLLEHGIAVEGVVLERSSQQTQHTIYTLKYSFLLPSSLYGCREKEGEVSVDKDTYDAHPPGTPMTILYLPDDTTRHAPYRLVARQNVVQIDGAPPSPRRELA